MTDTLIKTTFPASLPPAPYPTTDRQAEIIELADRLAAIAAANADRHDRDNTFPFDTYDALKESGYLALAVPEEFGGFGATPLELMLGQQRIGWGDGSVGLSSTMHHLQTAGVASNMQWPPELRERVLRDVVEHGALINSIASEPDLGSPSRGGLYKTTATRDGDHWVIDGRKTFSTLSPALTWGVVLLTVIDGDTEPTRGTFLVKMDSPGIRVDYTWDTMAMRATGSNDVIFDHVIVPDGNRLPQAPGLPAGDLGPWNLIGSAVFLGIATAARDFAVDFARNRRPTAQGGRAIAELQTVQHRVAQMELLLLQANSVLYGTAELAQRLPEERKSFGWRFAASKYVATNNAIAVTDQAMRVVGSVGLFRSNPLERYFRDVRAGTGNPPMDDVALTTIGKSALGVE
ncbi:MAG: acyl-CoA/acyl-ACP dehydrogenase [Thermomicrobiales bacterium]|nr:acyl-CoA/acyl-ACP dehydrogenase [Thermomicrobiales bacterium]MCO5220754.1 acyl-CoA/acyl-ACP dehydrogenase [Thermomicrobiales bacterium]